MTCQDCWDLHVAEKKSNGTGGAVHDADKRYYNELMYQKNCFRLIFVSVSLAGFTGRKLQPPKESNGFYKLYLVCWCPTGNS